jgi:predicted RNA binding protein YcfA (HicA-like mRNA interferase family)
MNIEKIIRKFKKLGFKIEHGDGSIAKMYHPERDKPFYSLHIGEKAIHPLRRFAKSNWDIDIRSF